MGLESGIFLFFHFLPPLDIPDTLERWVFQKNKQQDRCRPGMTQSSNLDIQGKLPIHFPRSSMLENLEQQKKRFLSVRSTLVALKFENELEIPINFLVEKLV